MVEKKAISGSVPRRMRKSFGVVVKVEGTSREPLQCRALSITDKLRDEESSYEAFQ